MTPSEALDLALAKNPGFVLVGSALETNSKFLFELSETPEGPHMDIIYSVDKDTGAVDHYSPIGDPEFGFDKGMQMVEV